MSERPTTLRESIEAALATIKDGSKTLLVIVAGPDPWEDTEALALVGDEPLLNESREFGFGTQDGPPIYGWTATHVIVPCSYDGAQWHEAVPIRPSLAVNGYLGG